MSRGVGLDQRCVRRLAMIACATLAWVASPAGAAFGQGAGAECTAGAVVLASAVSDATGAVIAGARVVVSSAGGAVLAEARTDAAGRFSVCAPRSGPVQLVITMPGFAPWRQIAVPGTVLSPAILLALAPVSESLTVTAVRGDARPAGWTPEFVSVADRASWQDAGALLLPASFRQALGLHVQQTSTSQASPYVRGLTGQQVVALVDGIRFNTATWRPGANQYTALLDPAIADRVEVVRGPSATQYGSDSLGGTVNVLTRPAGSWTSRAVSGELLLGGATADRSVVADVAGGWSGTRTSLFLHAGGRAAGDLRAGGGVDSHSVATRLFALPSAVLGSRLDQTGFRQWSGAAKLSVRPVAGHAVGVTWLRDAQRGASRYDMLDGGAGNLLHRFDPQSLGFASVRYDGPGAGPLATWSAAWSYNAQRDDRTYQNVNNAKLGLASDVSAERNRTRAMGGQVIGALAPLGRHAVRAGTEVYTERVDATRRDSALVPATGLVAAVTDVRPRVPNGATYDTVGVFAQDVITAWPDRLSITLGGRYSRFAYRQKAADNPVGTAGPLVPDFSTSFGELTGNAGAVLALTSDVRLTANVARGFRAPNVNDFGTIGVSGGGFEIAPDEARRVDGAVLLAGAAAPTMVGLLGPERVWSYDVGVRGSWRRLSVGASAFLADLDGMIERRTVLLPPGATGTLVGGQVVTRQDASGAIYTPAASTAVFVRVNGGRVRLRGVDLALDGRAGGHVSWSVTGAFVHGVDRADDRPPRIENGLPSGHGTARLRWTSTGGRLWAATGLTWAAPQPRLSENDLQQARIAGRRTAPEIRDYFNNGAIARGLVRDGRLLATGETLDQVIARVLGGASVDYLLTRMPGFAVVDVGVGGRLSRYGRLSVSLENVGDVNYRTMGSGVDGPGRSVVVRHVVEF